MIQVGQRVKARFSIFPDGKGQKKIDELFDAVVVKVPTPVDRVQVQVFKDGKSIVRWVHPANIKEVKQ